MDDSFKGKAEANLHLYVCVCVYTNSLAEIAAPKNVLAKGQSSELVSRGFPKKGQGRS